jgi:gliding motility-associated-like protein
LLCGKSHPFGPERKAALLANSIYLQLLIKVNLKQLFITGAFLLTTSILSAQLTAEAGSNTVICPGLTYNLGGAPTASGGTPPYSYSWTPSATLNNGTISNPVASPTVPTWYYVTVSDSGGVNSAIDSVFVDLNPIYAYNAGPDTSVCIGDSVTLGNPNNSFAGGVTYTWVPATDLDDANAPRPVFSGTVTTTYTLTITSPVCNSKQYVITVTVHQLPNVDASGGTRIEEGQSTPLTVTGASTYVWMPPDGLSSTTGSLVNAEPINDVTYIVFGTDVNGCVNWDTVTVHVTPNSDIHLYNTFSPNNDGVNDFFFIGNIQKYPDNRLEIFTRTGQQVYAKTNYDNTWDGTNYGDKLPETTYYFTLDLGDGNPVIYGHVTIVR